MRVRNNMVFLLVATVGMALPVVGQVARGRTSNVEMTHAHTARLPYTAEYKSTQVKTLADGTTITHEFREVVALDSQGRRMTATTTIPSSEDQTPRTHIMVFDPLGRTNSSWSVPGQKATVTSMPAPGSARPSCATTATAAAPAHVAPTAGVPRERPVVEELGTETINGVEAHGRRTTTTTPAGAIGNNEPLVRTNETWMAVAPGLSALIVRQLTDDPQMGQNTKELVSLNQSEPDSSLFQPPAEYEIVNREALVATCAGNEGTDIPMAPIAPPPAPEQ
jgi:hypothetical protein